MAALEINLLGGFEARLGSGEALPLKGRKTQALVAYLAYHPGQRHSREELVGLLWGDRGEEQARSSLRQSLSELRKALGDGDHSPLIAERDAVSLDADGVDVDVAEFENLLDDGTPAALGRAVKIYRGSLLDGIGVHDQAFEDWLRDERRRLHEQVCDGLSKLLEHQTAGDTEQAIATARRLLALDPLREVTHRALMRLYAGKGERPLALKQYQACCDVLRAELGLEPSAETQELNEVIRQEDRVDSATLKAATAAEPTEALSLPDKPSIAVLPFVNLSGDAEQEYFADGITEDLITNLCRFRDLFVIASHSSFAYKGKAVKIQDVSHELSVQYVLEGSVRKVEERVRISVQLVDGHSGRQLWTERFDRQLDDIFKVQDEVTEIVVGTLASGYGGRLRKAWQKRPQGRKSESALAFDYFLRGLDVLEGWTREDNRRGKELIEKAIALDSNYAKAYGKLAWCHILDAVEGWADDYDASLKKGQACATRGIEVEDNESWPHWALAGCYIYMMQHDLAQLEFERAIELNPNDADVLTDVGFYLAYAGKAEEGLDFAAKGMRLNPYYPEYYVMQLGQIYFEARQYENAVATFGSLRNISTTVSCLYLAASHAALSQSDESKEAIRRALALDPTATLEKWTSDKFAPYKKPEDQAHFRENLRKAGLPD